MPRSTNKPAMSSDEFAAWMQRLGLDDNAAAAVLGLARRTVIYYRTGERGITRTVRLACERLEMARDLPTVRRWLAARVAAS